MDISTTITAHPHHAPLHWTGWWMQSPVISAVSPRLLSLRATTAAATFSWWSVTIGTSQASTRTSRTLDPDLRASNWSTA